MLKFLDISQELTRKLELKCKYEHATCPHSSQYMRKSFINNFTKKNKIVCRIEIVCIYVVDLNDQDKQNILTC
jgi:hypothetical protein